MKYKIINYESDIVVIINHNHLIILTCHCFNMS